MMENEKNEVAVRLDGETLVISLSGSINSDSAKSIRGKVDDLLLTSKPNSVFMDMSQVDDIDSAGLGFCLAEQHKPRK